MSEKPTSLKDKAVDVKHRVKKRLHDAWVYFLIRGVLAIALAVFAFFWPTQTVGLFTKILGVYFLIDGVANLIGAWNHSDRGGSYLAGGVGTALGLFLIFQSNATDRLVLILLGVWALIQGIGMLVSAWQASAEDTNRSVLGKYGGLITFAGVVMVFWPGTGIVVISWLIAIIALAVGIFMLTLAFRMNKTEERVQEFRESHHGE